MASVHHVLEKVFVMGGPTACCGPGQSNHVNEQRESSVQIGSYYEPSTADASVRIN